METINIRGKIYEIIIEDRLLINVENQRDKIKIENDDMLDHYRSIVRGY